MQRPFLRPLIVLATVLGALACGNEAGSRYVMAKMIPAGPGGTLEVTSKESAVLAGTRLEVPAGALSADTRITLELGLDDLVAAEDVAGPVAVWGPAGTQFSRKARMTLPLSISSEPGELTVEVREADGRQFELPASAVAVAGGRISFDVEGFTGFQPRRRTRACAQDAFQCPDGTVVGRTGRRCEFVCPGARDGGGMCSPVVCTLACPNGFARDAVTGCEVCQCQPASSLDGGPTVCPADAFQCPDGTFVARTGPRCEFVCPGAQDGGGMCSPVVCTLACPYGFARDTVTGCEVCQCQPAPALDGGPTVCPTDAFQCPDGTFVGRSGARCEFVCPGAQDGGGMCSPVVCTLACPYGFARDAVTGCEVCQCQPAPALDGGPTVCPTDAFQCPNGTFVTRTGPMCSFPACPASDAGSGPVLCGGAVCASGQVCLNNTCTTPRPCMSTQDCTGMQTCQSGVCR
jgi:hypothetical protein